MSTRRLSLKRAYEPAAAADGMRILVDRLWPRGLDRQHAAIDEWLKDVAPTAELRKWFGHDPKRWSEFRKRYLAELAHNQAVDRLRELVDKHPVTLVYGARDTEHNQALVLRDFLDAAKGGS
jgi:uncharacterized protein YeaO (DUF488 family)